MIPRRKKRWWHDWFDDQSDDYVRPRKKLPPPAAAPSEIAPSPVGEPVYVLTFEIYDSDGDPITVRASTRAMISGSYDLMERVLDPGSRSRQAIDNSAVPGFVSTSFGEVELINEGSPGPYDEWADYATNGGKVTCEFGYYGDIYPYQFRTVYIAYIRGRPQFNGRTMRLSLGGREWLFDKKIVEAGFTGDSGEAAGGTQLEIEGIPGSQPRQILCGDAWYFKPVLTNDLDNVWFVCDNPIATVVDAWDGGVELNRAGGFGTPADGGEFRVLEKSNGAVFIQPVTDIRFELRVRAEGLRASADLSPRAWTICDLAQLAGVTGVDPNDMPAGSFNYSAGNHLFKDQTFKDILDDVGRYQIATIFFDRLNRFCARPLTPSFEGSSSFTFKDSGPWADGVARNLTVQAIPGLEKRKYKVRVRAGKCERSALAAAVADGSIAPEIRDDMSRDPYVVDFIGNIIYNSGAPYYQASTIRDKDPTSDEAEVTIASFEFPDETSMVDYVGKYMALYGSHHIGLSFEIPFSFNNMGIELLDKITIQTTRYGGNRQAVVWLINERLKDNVIFIGAWSHRESDAPDSSIAYISKNDAAVTGSGGGGSGSGATGRGAAAPQLEHDYINLTDKTTALTTGASAQKFTAPYDGAFDASCYAGVDTVLSSGTLVIDVKKNGVSVMSTKFNVESGDDNSLPAATQPVFQTTTFSRGDVFTFHLDSVGSGGKGAYICLIFRQV